MKLFFFPHRRQIIMLLCITSRGASQMQRRIAQNAWRHFRSQRLLEAEQACVEACPEDAEAHAILGRALLLAGELREGFAEYEWRLRNNEQRYPVSKDPSWDGSTLAGRSILVRAEQGLGDTLQFVRYIPLLARQAARVVFQCQPPLLDLLSGLNGPSVVITCEPYSQEIGVESWLLSLPRQFATTLESIPSEVPY